MKPDKLERFVMAHREAFDRAAPAPHVWERLEAALHGPFERRRPSLWRRIRVAAAAAALLVAGALGGALWTAHGMRQPEAIAREVAPDFEELTHYYLRSVSNRLARIEDPAVRRELERELGQLDRVQEELRAALAEAPASEHEAIVQTMIANYHMRLELLERVLARIQRGTHSRNAKRQKDETKKSI